MIPSADAYALIHGSESCRLSAYRDTGGVWTIGWGHTPAYEGQTCTQEQADAWLKQDVRNAALSVEDLTRNIELKQYEYDALVSLVYNIGHGQFELSTLLQLLRKGNKFAAAREFTRWFYDNGRPIEGLFFRRLRETILFMGRGLR